MASKPAARLIAIMATLMFLITSVVGAAGEYRMLWVDIFNAGFRTPQEIDTMLQYARAANYNAVVVEARKACDAFYNSSIEPKNKAIAPDFDPLAYLIQQAHDTSGGKQRIEVHPWLVAYRARIPGDNMWQDPRHVFHAHPEWLSSKYNGGKEGSGENKGRFYLDPGVPAVIDYTLTVVRDILSKYDVDGIMFDYIRYPEAEGAGNQWGYNPTAIARFNKLYGRTGKPAPNDPQFDEFRRMQVSQLVRKVYAHVRAWRPNVKVGAATIAWGTVSKGFAQADAYKTIFQDWQGLAQEGSLDILSPMNYKREHVSSQAADHRVWAQYLGALAQQTGRFGVNMVDGEKLNDMNGIVAQVSATRNLPGISGIGSYSYAETRSERTSVPDALFFRTMRDKFYRSPTAVPEARWLTRPTEGMVKGVVTRGGRVWDGALVKIGDRSAITDGTGFYAIARLAPGQLPLSVSDGKNVFSQTTVDVKAGGVTEAPVTVK